AHAPARPEPATHGGPIRLGTRPVLAPRRGAGPSCRRELAPAMCGIAGQVDFTGQHASPALLKAMQAAIARRGPDAQATWTDGPCALVHTRLSIIDVAGSPQPMTADGGAFAIAFNGEIFNYQELRG